MREWLGFGEEGKKMQRWGEWLVGIVLDVEDEGGT